MTSKLAGLSPALTKALSTAQIASLQPSDIAVMTTAQAAVLSAAQVDALSKSALQSLSSAQIQAIATSTIAGLAAGQVAALTPAQIAAMTPAQIAALTTAEIEALTTSDIAVLSTAQAEALTPAQMAALTAAQAGALTAKDVAVLSSAQINGLTAQALQALTGLTAAQAAGFTAKTIGALSATQFAALIALSAGTLTAAQAAGLTTAEIQALTAAETAALSTSVAAALSTTQIGALSATQAAALTVKQIAVLSATQIGALTTAALDGFGASQIADLTATQAAGLSSAQLSALSLASLTAFSSAAFAGIIGKLSAATLASMTTQTFDSLLGSHLSLISTSALQGISVADLSSLTSAELGSFTATQLAAMSAAQLAVVKGGNVNPILADAAAHEVNGSLSYTGMLAVLQEADTSGMTAQKMTGLQVLAAELNTTGGIQTSAYVQQITDDVVLGNSANATWNGGSSTATALGDLTASSTQTQLQELIGKWFLGTDLPSTNLTAVGQENFPITYEAVNEPLFTTNNDTTPSTSNINQGYLGDCYFLSAIGEIALQDPTTIENMITENSNGTYSVEFQINGKADCVTVNDELPEISNGGEIYPGTSLVFENGNGSLWAPLVEKAFVQLDEQSGVATGELGVNGDAYEDIAGGWWQGLTEVTGQSVNSYSASSSILSTLQTAFTSHEDVIMATGGGSAPSGSNLVDGHMYMVTGVNAAAGTVSLLNPWGTSGAGCGLEMSFTDSISTLAANGAMFGVTTGKSALG